MSVVFKGGGSEKLRGCGGGCRGCNSSSREGNGGGNGGGFFGHFFVICIFEFSSLCFSEKDNPDNVI